MKLGMLFLAGILFLLPGCASGRVDPKADPQNFKVIDWMPRDYKVDTEVPVTGDALTKVLQEHFPLGTPRQNVEKYILASGDLKPFPMHTLYSDTNGKQTADTWGVIYNAQNRYTDGAAICQLDMYASYDYVNELLISPIKYRYFCRKAEENAAPQLAK